MFKLIGPLCASHTALHVGSTHAVTSCVIIMTDSSMGMPS